VGFKFYAGGTQGSDLDVLRKIRTGQLQGGGLTGVGLGEIESSLRIMELPFIFLSDDEVSEAHQQLDPIFEEKVRDRGFEILGWAELGFVYLFSQEPIHSADALRSMKMWLWEGDPLAKELITSFGVSPVPLNMTDVLTSLQTGIVNTVYSTPYGALSLQWSSRVKYMMDVPISYGLGAVVVDKKSYNRMNDAQKQIVATIADDVFSRLAESTRLQNLEARQAMLDRNVELVDVDSGAVHGFVATGNKVWDKLAGDLYERQLLDKLTSSLQASR
jgi:TRAP-type transport system periplasmic protein